MKNRFTQKAQNALNAALTAATEMGHNYIGSEHLLLGLCREENGVAAHYLKSRGVDAEKVKNAILRLAGAGVPSAVSASDMTPRTRSIIQASLSEAQKCAQELIGTEHLLLALLHEQDSVGVRILESFGIAIPELTNELSLHIGAAPTTEGAYVGKQKGTVRESRSPLSGTQTLKSFARDLCELVAMGKIDPVIGRTRETERLIQILSRRTKNNPCLIGEPGVGKTAVVEGLAARIVEGNVPETLADKTVVVLDIASMIAGAKYRGEFEERFKGVMEEVRKNPNIILFIDEIHTIIGAGAAEGAVDAANIIKPALARGEMQVIGATTLAEYRRHIEKDAALERRFQSVTVGEPSPEEALEILLGLREKYETHHKLKIADDALRAAVELSVRYIADRYLPDKAIDLIDEAASRLRLRAHTSPEALKTKEEELKSLCAQKEAAILAQEFERAATLRDSEQSLRKEIEEHRSHWKEQQNTLQLTVTEADIAEVVTQWTGIPVSNLLEEEGERLRNLESLLEARVIGQKEATAAVAKAIRRGRIGLKDPRRPIGSFIFMGPTGIGKTELARALAEVMFGSQSTLIRIDMSEYMEKHSVSKLIGSPPGYVGFDEGGQLTEKIRRKPYSVLLFDEIEKAHPDVFNILLQVLEDGHLTDSQGRQVDFKNTVIILTSNVGASEVSSAKTLGFVTDAQESADTERRERMMRALRSTFRPEFLNRVDEIIVFSSLSQEDIETIAALMLDDVIKRCSEIGISLSVSPEVTAIVAQKGFDANWGARPLRRTVTRMIEDRLSTDLLEGKFACGDSVKAIVQEEKIVFEKNES